MKKYIPAIVMAALILIFCGASAVMGRGSYFSDVDENDPNYPFIVEIAQDGILAAYGDDYFGAKEPVSRGTAMEEILEAIDAVGLPLEEAAVLHRLVYTFDEAMLDQPITRLEAAQMAARALDLLPMAGKSPYDDCDDGYVVKLWEKQVWNSGSRFRPNETLTRGELAMLLWHMQRADVSQEAFRYNNYWVEELDGVAPYNYDFSSFKVTDGVIDYLDPDYTVLQGVDVSEFQRNIDWEKVKADGIDFAIIRVGGRYMQSGGIYDDSYFQRNVEGALAAGLRVGVYFFSQAISAEEGLEEAEYVLSRIADYEITMPVVMDWEPLGGSDSRVYGIEPEQVTQAARAFSDRILEAGYEPMLYINSYSGYIKLDLRQVADVGLWFAQYFDVPVFRYHFDMWQYTDSGQVDGISANVDRNLYFQK